jgi:hypothetical protein
VGDIVPRQVGEQLGHHVLDGETATRAAEREVDRLSDKPARPQLLRPEVVVRLAGGVTTPRVRVS